MKKVFELFELHTRLIQSYPVDSDPVGVTLVEPGWNDVLNGVRFTDQPQLDRFEHDRPLGRVLVNLLTVNQIGNQIIKRAQPGRGLGTVGDRHPVAESFVVMSLEPFTTVLGLTDDLLQVPP